MKKEDKEKVDEVLKHPSSVMDDMGKDEKRSEVSDFSKTVEILLDSKHKRRKTILNNNKQVALITSLDVIAQLYDITFLKQWIDNYAEWRTSGDKGKGRQDIVDISKFHYAEMQKRDDQIFNLLRGR